MTGNVTQFNFSRLTRIHNDVTEKFDFGWLLSRVGFEDEILVEGFCGSVNFKVDEVN